jgi:hypothetical protein
VLQGGIDILVAVALEMEVPSAPPSPAGSPAGSPRPAAASSAKPGGVVALLDGAASAPFGPPKAASKASPFGFGNRKAPPLLFEASAADVAAEAAGFETPRGTFLEAKARKTPGAKKAKDGPSDGHRKAPSPAKPPMPGPEDNPAAMDGGRRLATVFFF